MAAHASIRSRVSALIKSHDANLCDACILKELRAGDIRQVNDATRQLAKGGLVLGYVRKEGRCELCGEVRLVIRSTK